MLTDEELDCFDYAATRDPCLKGSDLAELVRAYRLWKNAPTATVRRHAHIGPLAFAPDNLVGQTVRLVAEPPTKEGQDG